MSASLTYKQAREVMCQVFKTAWDTTAVLPAGPFPALYPDVPGDVPDSVTVWARVTLRHATGGRASLSGPINGCVTHNRGGVGIIQIFAPVGGGMNEAYDAAQLVANAYEDANVDVWFRNVRVNEIGTKGNSEQINVLFDFSYHETR